jgi:fructose-bisphosphate aldolase class II
MPLLNSATIYQHAEQEGYIVPGFDSYNLEALQAQVIAANSENSPFLLQITPKGFRHIGMEYFFGMARALIAESRVPVALHLDHGTSLSEIVLCIKNGFTSVMIDGSALSFEENIKLTKKVADIAHSVGVSVEAELGRVLGKESDISVKEGQEVYTDPDSAEEFVERTGIDSLAVSVGTVHGFYQTQPNIDYSRLEKIHHSVKIPLVFHGGTGLGAAILHKGKINIGTAIKDAFTSGVKEYMNEHPGEIDPRKILGSARENVVEELKKVICLFGAKDKNWFHERNS